jgi:hypothetical protein
MSKNSDPNLPTHFRANSWTVVGKVTVDKQLQAIDGVLQDYEKVPGAFLANPSGGTVIDVQGRTSINAINAILIANGLMAAS